MTSLEVGQGCRPFLLNARGRIEGSFFGYRVNDTDIWLDTAKNHGVQLAERLDMFHFGEDFQISPATNEYRHMVVAGPHARATLNR